MPNVIFSPSSSICRETQAELLRARGSSIPVPCAWQSAAVGSSCTISGLADCGSGPVICGAGISCARHSVFVLNSPWWILLPGIYLANSKSLCTHSFLWQAVSQLNNTYCLVLPIFSYPEAGWVFSAGRHSRPAPDPADKGEMDGWVDGIWNSSALWSDGQLSAGHKQGVF